MRDNQAISPVQMLLREYAPRLVIAALCLLAVGAAWFGLNQARVGLTIRDFTRGGVPLRLVMPAEGAELPAVIVAHGFSGSRQLMQSYAYTLAHNGYAALLLDFTGHGANPTPSDRDGTRSQLLADLATARAALAAEPAIDRDRLSLLGHSMGSGVVLQAGVTEPELYDAVIAISPGDVDVDDRRPPNLLLQAGQFEAPYAARAAALLAEAGGPSTAFADGRARAAVIVPGVEHITILFSPGSLTSAVTWLDNVYGRTSPLEYRDWRMVYYGVHLVGWFGFALALAPLLAPLHAAPSPERRRPWHWLGLMLWPFVATGAIAVSGSDGALRSVSGVAVGGTLALWALIFGLLWLGVGFRPTPPSRATAIWSVILFGFYWVAFGVMAQQVWLPWNLIPPRLSRWPLFALAFFPWQLAASLAQQGASAVRRAAWWLAQSVLLAGALLLAVMLVPSLGFLFIVLPVLPLVLALMTLGDAVVQRPWAAAAANAGFFAWIVLTLFPLV